MQVLSGGPHKLFGHFNDLQFTLMDFPTFQHFPPCPFSLCCSFLLCPCAWGSDGKFKVQNLPSNQDSLKRILTYKIFENQEDKIPDKSTKQILRIKKRKEREVHGSTQRERCRRLQDSFDVVVRCQLVKIEVDWSLIHQEHIFL